jgi:hypothetical protein
MEQKFVTFEIERPANGFERGWYFRMTGSLYDEPVGPFSTKYDAEIAARRGHEHERKQHV